MILNDVVVKEYRWMLGKALKLCRNRMDAEDLVEDAVLKILSSVRQFEPDRPFRPWASVIILNTYRTRYNHENLVTTVGVEEESITSLSDNQTQSRVMVSEIWSAVERARCRSSSVDCVMMYSEGYTYEEIAEYYSIPTGTVRSRINYARNILREELDRQ